MRWRSVLRVRRLRHEPRACSSSPARLIYFFLMLPLLVVFPISLSSAPYMQFPPPGLSWQWYERYLDDPQWIDATWRSLIYRRCDRGPRPGAGRAAGLHPGAGEIPRPRAARSAGAGAHHRADHHSLGRRLRPVRQAEADRRMVWAGRGAHRAGAALRGSGDDGRPARLRSLAGTGCRGSGRQPRSARFCASPCRCCGRAWSRPGCWPSSPRSTSWWLRCSWPAPT